MTSFPSLLESIDDLAFEQIEMLVSRARQFKSNSSAHQLPIQPKPILATLFFENSTRTKHSFSIAADRLNVMHVDFNAEKSSLSKGETLEDTFLTLHHQGVNICVLRTSVGHQLSEFKKSLPIKIINGGDGTNEHPTQALLDLMTLLDLSQNIIRNKTIAIIGDINHSRVAHSLVKILTHYKANIILCGPLEFLPKEAQTSNVKTSLDRDDTIKKADFIYLLRVQKERHEKNENSSPDDYVTNFGVTLEKLKSLDKLVPILHPGPANVGVEIDHDLIRSSLYKGHLQVQNSIPMRMAIIEAMLLNNDQNIGNIHGEKF